MFKYAFASIFGALTAATKIESRKKKKDIAGDYAYVTSHRTMLPSVSKAFLGIVSDTIE
jgi:hypothetical protein